MSSVYLVTTIGVTRDDCATWFPSPFRAGADALDHEARDAREQVKLATGHPPARWRD